LIEPAFEKVGESSGIEQDEHIGFAINYKSSNIKKTIRDLSGGVSYI
jgi:hypothetical protein